MESGLIVFRHFAKKNKLPNYPIVKKSTEETRGLRAKPNLAYRQWIFHRKSRSELTTLAYYSNNVMVSCVEYKLATKTKIRYYQTKYSNIVTHEQCIILINSIIKQLEIVFCIYFMITKIYFKISVI